VVDDVAHGVGRVCTALVQHCDQRKDALLASLCAEGPLQPLPVLGSSHPFSKAQVCQKVWLPQLPQFDCSCQL
jgi:hypothetical protein